jgi:hypothetical protein
MVDDHLDEREPTEVFYFSEHQGINDGDEIENANEIVEVVGERNEKIFSLRDLKEESDGQQKSEDDDAA